MPKACSQCGCTDIDTDPSRGDVVCTNCGTVLEDQIIISEVQYQENAAGGASVIGQFVSNDGSKAQSFRGAYGFGSEDSRKLVLENGYKRLKDLGGRLRMHQSSVDTAFGFFKIAVANKFTKGRKMEYVLASCLYLVCRVDPGGSEDLELMLIDFSDLIQVNVHVLGRTFVQLAMELCQNIRIVDPIIYIRRFANQLHFGDKTNKVVESATRLVGRMKRDWMHTGRRPAGLCGAALLISARMHNFNRTVDHIIKVVKVCESTVRKRLLEFDSTPSAQLTIEEFDNVDLEAEQDPPCFTEGKRKAKLAQEKINSKDEGLTESMIKELNTVQDNINKSLRRKSIASSAAEEGTSTSVEDRIVKAIDTETVKSVSGSDWHDGEWEGLGSINETPAETPDIVVVSQEEETEKVKDGYESGEDNKTNVKSKVEDGELDLTGIDDDEIDQGWARFDQLIDLPELSFQFDPSIHLDESEEESELIMSDDEVQEKSRWFDIEFGDFMNVVREREEKKRLKEEAAAKKRDKNPKAKKKRRKDFDVDSMRAECMEILKKDMMERKFSDKINYSVLSNLDVDKGEDVINREPILITDEEPSVNSTTQFRNRFKKPAIPDLPTDKKKKTPPKRVRIDDEVTVVQEKRPKLEALPVETQVTEISTEPLPYEEQADPEDLLDEEEEEDDEDEGEDKILTARQLLSQEVSAYDEEEEYLY